MNELLKQKLKEKAIVQHSGLQPVGSPKLFWGSPHFPNPQYADKLTYDAA